MFDNKPASLLSLCFLVCVTEEPQELKVHPGQDAVLQCLTPKPTSPSLLLWVRPDLESGGYVYFRRGTKPSHWHPSYDGRVELKDPEMKDGDISVMLKNVTFTDSGRYECQTGDGSTEDGPRLICTIILKVEHSGHSGGHKDGGDTHRHVGLTGGLLIFWLLLLLYLFM
ncbi:butyrophilin-like protein 2 [Mastacembelus armatus]|uniref:butyrophilin-like protein 2 n=1 Tax=Mastacembelus armatus TaxID=205130 RepID=UPI000E4594DD|nr:butyrophilin-like protein 2 [Mastacembelus armatus]